MILQIPSRFLNDLLFSALCFQECQANWDRTKFSSLVKSPEFLELYETKNVLYKDKTNEELAEIFGIKFFVSDGKTLKKFGKGKEIYIKKLKTRRIYSDPCFFFYLPEGLKADGQYITRFDEMLNFKQIVSEKTDKKRMKFELDPCPLKVEKFSKLEEKYNVSINIFSKTKNDETNTYYYETKRLGNCFLNNILNLHLQEETKTYFMIVDYNLYFQNYHACPNRSEGCLLTFSKPAQMKKHILTCKSVDELQNHPQIIQKELRNTDFLLNKAKSAGILLRNPENKNFVFFDIECVLPVLNYSTPKMRILNTHKLVSIAANSYINNEHETRSWVVNDSSLESEIKIVDDFLEFCFQAKEKMRIAPETEKLIECLRSLGNDLQVDDFDCDEISELKNMFLPFADLSVFGYNNSHYDNQVIFQHIITCLDRRNFKPQQIRFLKKGPHYFSLNFQNIHFKDLMNFSIPARLDKYLKTWTREFSKLTYPYELFSSIDEIKACKEFPTKEQFFSTLTGEVDLDVYLKCEYVYNYHHQLPEDHSEYWADFSKYLEFYNISDVYPASLALIKQFETYETNFGIYPMQFLGLPSFARAAMLKLYDANCSSIFTFSKNSEATEIFRKNTIGGLCNVYHRHITTRNESEVPESAKYNSFGQKWRKISFFDINAQYPSTFKKKFPCGLGFEWENFNGVLYKKLMTTKKISLGSIEWLDFVQQTDLNLVDKFGDRKRIISGWGSQEMKIGPYYVDGYAKVDGKIFIFEYDGCFFHGCKICQKSGLRRNDCERISFLEKTGAKIIRMQECIWLSQKTKLTWIPKISPIVSLRKINESQMINLFEKNLLYGFAVIDIESTQEAKKFLDVNWPPIIFKADIEYNDLPKWMQKNCDSKDFPRQTIIQGMNRKEFLTHTDCLFFYLQNGFKVTKIHKFFEYEGQKCFKQVHDAVYQARVEATENGDDLKSTAVKLVSNSMYGQMLMVKFLMYSLFSS